MNERPSQVSPFLVAAHSTSSEVFDFHIWFSTGFVMQSRQARSDPSSCMVRSNSSSALILLWLFLHLHLLVFFSTSLQDYWWNWNGWCSTNTKKMIPFITCEISLSQHVCELPLGVNVFDLDLGIQIDSIKQPIKSNSVGSGYMSHCRASSIYDHLDHCFVVFKDIQQSFLTRRIHVWGNQHCLDHQSFHEFSFATIRSHKSSAGIPSNLNPASKEMISASVELCETEVCFLHLQLVGTNVWLRKMHRHCFVVFPTWQYCL